VDLLNRLNWNLIKRENYQVIVTKRDAKGYEYTALADLNVVVQSPVLMVGVKTSNWRTTWKTGGWASMQLPITPSSTTEFTAFVEADSRQWVRLLLHKLNLVRFPYLGISPYILNLSFPYWFEDMFLEIWQYGENVDGTFNPPNVELYQIDRKIEFIARRDVPTTYDIE
jgi:hypothetical protein